MAKLKHLRSSVPGRRPAPSDFDPGQIFINTADVVFTVKDSAGNVVDVVQRGGWNTKVLDWDASTNIPPIPAASAANKGWVYVVGTAGTLNIDGQSDWRPNDLAVSLGTRWLQIRPNVKTTLNSSTSIGVSGDPNTEVGATISAVVDPSAGNALVATANGLRVDLVTVAINTDDSTSIDFTGDGTSAAPLSGTVRLSSDAGNALVGTATGLYVPTFVSSVEVEDSDSIVLTGDGTSALPIGAALRVDPSVTNALTVSSAGALVLKVTVNGKAQDSVGAITVEPEDIGDYGVAPLNDNGKVPLQYMDESLLGAVTYKGTWDPSTNTPILPDPEDAKGWYYVATAGGTIPGAVPPIEVHLGDWVISNGETWSTIDALDGVQSVAGKTGVVLLGAADITSGIFIAARLGATPGADRVLTTNGLGEPVWESRTVVSGVTSVGLVAPSSMFSVSGSPVTSSGNLTLSLSNVAANRFWAGPAIGPTADAPSYRAIVLADLPDIDEGEY